MQWFKSWMLSVAAPATSAEKYLYVLADALDIFFHSPLFRFSSRSSFFTGSLKSLPFAYFTPFPHFVMARFRVVSVFFSDFAVFLWCWRLYLSKGAKITVLIFIFEDIVFLLGEAFNFVELCFVIFVVILKVALNCNWELFVFQTASDRTGFFLTWDYRRSVFNHRWKHIKQSHPKAIFLFMNIRERNKNVRECTPFRKVQET